MSFSRRRSKENTMKNQKNCMPVGSYFIFEMELKPVGEKVLNKYGRICRAFLQKTVSNGVWCFGSGGAVVPAVA